jgi:hypothetical protein
VLAASRRRRIKQRVTLAASMLFIVVLAGYLLSRDVGDPQAAQNDPNAKQNENDQPDKIVEDDADGAPATDGGRQGTIADDGRTTWARPTAGKPISLKYVSGESHAYVYMRPQSLLSTTDGRQAFAALGPTAAWLRKQVRQAVGVPLQQIDRLTVALAGTPSGWPESSLVVELRKPRSNWLVDLGNPSKAQHAGETYYLGSQWAYYFPKTKANRILVAAPIEKIKAIIDERAKPTIPRRLSMRKLLAKTDSRQHITVLAEPNFLFSDGREMFADHARKLLDPLRAFITRDLNATMLSIFVNDYDFYFEVRLVPGSQRNAYSIQKDLTKRLENLGDDVEQYVAALKPQAFGNQLVQRLPTAVRQVVSSDRMRTSVDDGQFLLNTYLPSYAAAHLLLASELALAETPGGSSQPTGPTKPTTLAEQLKMPLTLVFDQMAFGDVVKELVNQSGAKIEVLGKDLEGDGITRNKEIRDFKMDKKPLHEMLVLLCMKNNPIPGIKLASDPNQKLVYVFGPSPTDGKDVILITTRKAAATKGYKLPAVFGSKG